MKAWLTCQVGSGHQLMKVQPTWQVGSGHQL